MSRANSPRVDLLLEGRIRQLLDFKKKDVQIIRQIKEDTCQLISRHKIYKVKKRWKEGKENWSPKKRKNHVMTPPKIEKLERLALQENPMTQKEMKYRLKVSNATVNKTLKKMNLKLRKKAKVQTLNEAQKEKRVQRAPELKQIILRNKLKLITSDESFFTLQSAGGRREIYYEKVGSNTCHNEKFFYENEERFSPKVMVWAGITYHGKSSISFIEPGAKVNSKYYQGNVIKMFLDNDRKRLFGEDDFIWHQDSAPSHVSGSTTRYMEENGMKFITKEQWPPKSPDLAPMDFFVWGWMKNRVRKYKFKTLVGLKLAIKRAWKELPQEFIQNAFDSWPNRLDEVVEAEGGHI